MILYTSDSQGSYMHKTHAVGHTVNIVPLLGYDGKGGDELQGCARNATAC